MHGPQWSDDPDTPKLLDNLEAVIDAVVLDAFAGGPLTAELVKRWHVQMYDGIPVPTEVYLGRFRGDSGHPWLIDAENGIIGGRRGVRSYMVFGAVEGLFERAQADIIALVLDESVSVKRDMEALRIAAYLHGEWVRIHPFVNGNGRTARLLVLWVLARFGIAPLLPVRPRPANPYGSVADASMAGDHEPFELYLRDLYASQNRRVDSDNADVLKSGGAEPPGE